MGRNKLLSKGFPSTPPAETFAGTSALYLHENMVNMDNKNRILQSSKGDAYEVIIERPVPGKPHKGKVLLVIQAHSDDVPLDYGGTVAKLMDEGYTGYLLRTSDDSSGDYEGNKKDNANIAKFYGMEKAYDFLYPHHRMDSIQIQDFKARLVFLFRLLKVDTVIGYDPWEHYEENPDHIATAHAVEAARWMAGTSSDYPEHLDAGLKPHRPFECYYFSRVPKRVNRVVDISNYIDKKVEVCMLNITKGPAGKEEGKKIFDRLAAEGKQLTILGSDRKMADFNYVKHFVLDIDAWRLNFSEFSNKEIGRPYGLEWAEHFHYINDDIPNNLEKYIKDHAETL